MSYLYTQEGNISHHKLFILSGGSLLSSALCFRVESVFVWWCLHLRTLFIDLGCKAAIFARSSCLINLTVHVEPLINKRPAVATKDQGTHVHATVAWENYNYEDWFRNLYQNDDIIELRVSHVNM